MMDMVLLYGNIGIYIIIIEFQKTHGGRMWAENNKDGEKGATFYFTPPLTK
jgi:signal transduction histidine kinase